MLLESYDIIPPMSREYPDRSGSLSDFVDGLHLRDADQRDARLANQADQVAWCKDNLRVHDYLKLAVDGLNFPGLVDRQREILRELPSFNDGQMALRTLSWIPDTSQETRNAKGQRIRAVYGHAVLLGSEGVNGGLSGKKENIDSAFYALGVAVEEEDSEQLQFYQMTAPDKEQYGHELYNLLSEGKYESAILDYHRALKNARRNMDSAVPSIPMKVRGILKNFGRKITREEEMEVNFKRTMREIGETPTESSRVFITKSVNRLLLDHPPIEVPTLRDQIWDGFTNRRREMPVPTYAKHLQPLLDFDLVSSQQALALQFDAFLRSDPIIRGDK
jgi:hypothetical protein